MPELRKDPIVGRWVIISTERARRPVEYPREPTPPRAATAGFCPFCPGSEDKTPSEVLAFREHAGLANGPGSWQSHARMHLPPCRAPFDAPALVVYYAWSRSQGDARLLPIPIGGN